jgi:hypothetical protein
MTDLDDFANIGEKTGLIKEPVLAGFNKNNCTPYSNDREFVKQPCNQAYQLPYHVLKYICYAS